MFMNFEQLKVGHAYIEENNFVFFCVKYWCSLATLIKKLIILVTREHNLMQIEQLDVGSLRSSLA